MKEVLERRWGVLRREFVISLGGAALLPAAAKPHVVFVCGDHEYSGEFTLPVVAGELEKHYGMRCTVLKSVPDQNGEKDIPGLEALGSADLAVFYLRWRQLPEEQLAHIDAYVKAGKPVFGFRTTSHAFKYPADSPLARWNAWGSEAFGTPPGWGGDGHTHFGHLASTDVSVIPSAAGDPILQGISGPFHVRSWLYRVLPKWPPKNAKQLLMGHAVNPNKPAEDNPVAWTWRNQYGGRAFYTSMGHPEDFAVEPFQRLVINAIHWCLHGKVPARWKGAMTIHVPYRGMVATK
ncbi:MAG: ThuA domain-containing protein [Bryobacterales bacterium]|nr:ThuA domain-containing protein [Bryobacterales bacterium]